MERKQGKKLRVVFFSSTEFGVPTLSFLLKSGQYEVPLVVTRPAAPKGRKQMVTPSPIASFLEAKHPEVETAAPERLAHNDELRERIRALKPDAFLLASYGLILPASFLQLTEHPLCLHPSPLPKLRGPSPIREALRLGWEKTAVCVFKMTRQLDAGPVLLCREQEIQPEDDFGTLREKLALLSAQCAYVALRAVAAGTAQYIPQDEAQATYTRLLGPGDNHLDFRWDARRVVNFVRAMAPEPGAACVDPLGRRMKVLRASMRPQRIPGSSPGLVIGLYRHTIEIAAGDDNAVFLHEVQPEGGRVMSVADYLAGHRIILGDEFTSLPREEPVRGPDRSGIPPGTG